MVAEANLNTINPIPSVAPRETTFDARPRVWNKPPINGLAINCDASWMNWDKPAGVSTLARDYQGKILDGMLLKFFCDSPLVAEAYAL